MNTKLLIITITCLTCVVGSANAQPDCNATIKIKKNAGVHQTVVGVPYSCFTTGPRNDYEIQWVSHPGSKPKS
jgi:hypothetical protein